VHLDDEGTHDICEEDGKRCEEVLQVSWELFVELSKFSGAFRRNQPRNGGNDYYQEYHEVYNRYTSGQKSKADQQDHGKHQE